MLIHQKQRIIDLMYGDQILDKANPILMKRLMKIKQVA